MAGLERSTVEPTETTSDLPQVLSEIRSVGDPLFVPEMEFLPRDSEKPGGSYVTSGAGVRVEIGGKSYLLTQEEGFEAAVYNYKLTHSQRLKPYETKAS